MGARKRREEKDIIPILREAEVSGNIKGVCQKHGVHETTFYAWRRKYGGVPSIYSIGSMILVEGELPSTEIKGTTAGVRHAA